MSGSGGGNGSGVSMNKVAAVLTGATLAGIILIMGPRILPGGEDEDAPTPSPVVSPAAQPTIAATRPPATAAAIPAQSTPALNDDLRGGSENVILTIIAYGMPARISARAEDPTVAVKARVREQCIADVQFPNPCITDYVVRRGTVLIVEAGNSLSGFWPSLDYVRGSGCDLKESAADQTCRIQLDSDASVEAMYFGGESPGDPHYQFPTCPTNRGNSPQPWMSRCR